MRHGLVAAHVTLGILVGGVGTAEARKTVAVPDSRVAADAINRLGLELLGTATGEGNAAISPYSIQNALAMTYAGAAGDTKTEMAKVLHYPADDSKLHASFAALQKSLDQVEGAAVSPVRRTQKIRPGVKPVVLRVANRLFGQKDYRFRPPFLTLLRKTYRAPFEAMDFGHPRQAAAVINAWVARQTAGLIRDVVPEDGLDSDTRLVLVNTAYLNAFWEHAFAEDATKPRPFHLTEGKIVYVPTMQGQSGMGYLHRDGMTVVTVPYAGGRLRFVIILPDVGTSLGALQKNMTLARLSQLASLPNAEVILFLPRLTMSPPTADLTRALKGLGMKKAFDAPDFDAMAPCLPERLACLAMKAVYHKAFVRLDEKRTEAAAATAVEMDLIEDVEEPRRIEVHVDRPFLFAIQHRQSGAYLFLGRVVDPR